MSEPARRPAGRLLRSPTRSTRRATTTRSTRNRLPPIRRLGRRPGGAAGGAAGDHALSVRALPPSAGTRPGRPAGARHARHRARPQRPRPAPRRRRDARRRLAARLEGGPRPAILIRTPYRKESLSAQSPVDPRRAAERGYALVLQDVRGKGSSEGAFEPFVQERAGRLRLRRVGGGAALVRRARGHARRVVRRRDPVAGRLDGAARPARHRPAHQHGRLRRGLELPLRRAGGRLPGHVDRRQPGARRPALARRPGALLRRPRRARRARAVDRRLVRPAGGGGVLGQPQRDPPARVHPRADPARRRLVRLLPGRHAALLREPAAGHRPAHRRPLGARLVVLAPRRRAAPRRRGRGRRVRARRAGPRLLRRGARRGAARHAAGHRLPAGRTPLGGLRRLAAAGCRAADGPARRRRRLRRRPGRPPALARRPRAPGRPAAAGHGRARPAADRGPRGRAGAAGRRRRGGSGARRPGAGAPADAGRRRRDARLGRDPVRRARRRRAGQPRRGDRAPAGRRTTTSWWRSATSSCSCSRASGSSCSWRAARSRAGSRRRRPGGRRCWRARSSSCWCCPRLGPVRYRCNDVSDAR